MDLAAFLLIVVGIVLYFAGRKQSEKIIRWAIAVGCIGVGLLVGAVWGAAIVRSAF